MTYPFVSRRSAALKPCSDDDEMIGNINTTPLVDVMLVLLIIFLITVPVVTASVAVQLPNEQIQPRQVLPDVLNVSIDSAGRCYLADTEVNNPNDLLQRLQGLVTHDTQRPVHLLADANARYADVEKVIRALQATGFGKISFITEPQQP